MKGEAWMWSGRPWPRSRRLLAGCGGSSSSSSSAASSSSTSSGIASTSSASGSGAATGSPVVIGASLSLSGDFASDGQNFQKGYTLWADDHQQGGRPARPSGEARHRVGREQPGSGGDQLPEADLLRSRQAGVRAVLDAVDRAVLEGGQPLRLRVRRGRRRRAGRVRQRPAQHLRRQPAGHRQPRAVREVGRLAPGIASGRRRRRTPRATTRSPSRRFRSPRRSWRRPGSRPSTTRCSRPR